MGTGSLDYSLFPGCLSNCLLQLDLDLQEGSQPDVGETFYSKPFSSIKELFIWLEITAFIASWSVNELSQKYNYSMPVMG